jgi:hypothetical protein
MAFDGYITSLLGQGLAADRPATPNTDPGVIVFYYATDTVQLSMYADSTWFENVLVSSGDMLGSNNLSDVFNTLIARDNLGLHLVTTQSGTSYTADLADADSYILFTNASPVTFTIPPNTDVAFPIGTVIEFEQQGAGALTVAAGAGVTINSRGGDYTLAGQYSPAAVKKVGTNTWTLTGDL